MKEGKPGFSLCSEKHVSKSPFFGVFPLNSCEKQLINGKVTNYTEQLLVSGTAPWKCSRSINNLLRHRKALRKVCLKQARRS